MLNYRLRTRFFLLSEVSMYGAKEPCLFRILALDGVEEFEYIVVHVFEARLPPNLLPDGVLKELHFIIVVAKGSARR